MTIAMHHTDGGGVSDHVFALAHLLGFRFAPRIPNLAERRLYAFEPASQWPPLVPFIAGRPDDKLIVAHWDDMLRLAASVRTSVVSASLMLKRLGSYPRQNGLALALREIGRIERTLYTLDWLELPHLRRQATAELDKGESRNALARAVCFHRLGQLRDRTVEMQQHRASSLEGGCFGSARSSCGSNYALYAPILAWQLPLIRQIGVARSGMTDQELLDLVATIGHAPLDRAGITKVKRGFPTL